MRMWSLHRRAVGMGQTEPGGRQSGRASVQESMPSASGNWGQQLSGP
jgi:hypothetical protein